MPKVKYPSAITWYFTFLSLRIYVVNEACTNWKEMRHGPTTGSFPSGLSRTSIIWNYYLESIPMEIFGGFVGVSQDRHMLIPEIGFAIVGKCVSSVDNK